MLSAQTAVPRAKKNRTGHTNLLQATPRITSEQSVAMSTVEISAADTIAGLAEDAIKRIAPMSEFVAFGSRVLDGCSVLTPGA